MRTISWDYPIFDRSLRVRRLTHEEELQLTHTIQANPPKSPAGIAARNRMVRANLGLLVSTARKLHYINRPLVDRIQDGSLGLIRAAEIFNPAKGCRFSTYAYRRIRQAMRRGAITDADTIYLPEHIQLKIRRIDLAQQALHAELKPITFAAIAERSGLEVSEVNYLLDLKRRTLSFDEPIAGPDVWLLGDTIDDKGKWVAQHERSFLLGQVHEAIETLPPNQRSVWKLIAQGDLTQVAIADQLGINPNTAKTYRNRGLANLKTKLTINV